MTRKQTWETSFFYYPCEETSGILYTFLIRESLKKVFNSQSFANLKVLDIGSGMGWVAEEFDKQGATAYALDISPSVCNFIRERSNVKDFNVSIVCCDGEHLPFKKDAFDVAIINATLHHFPSPKKALDDAMRITNELYIINEPCQIKYLNCIVGKVTKIFDKFGFLKALTGVRYTSVMDIDKTRFNICEIKHDLAGRGYDVEVWRYWCYVPPFLQRTKSKIVVNIYKSLITMLNKVFQTFGHTFYLRAHKK